MSISEESAPDASAAIAIRMADDFQPFDQHDETDDNQPGDDNHHLSECDLVQVFFLQKPSTRKKPGVIPKTVTGVLCLGGARCPIA